MGGCFWAREELQKLVLSWAPLSMPGWLGRESKEGYVRSTWNAHLMLFIFRQHFWRVYFWSHSGNNQGSNPSFPPARQAPYLSLCENCFWDLLSISIIFIQYAQVIWNSKTFFCMIYILLTFCLGFYLPCKRALCWICISSMFFSLNASTSTLELLIQLFTCFKHYILSPNSSELHCY